VTQHSYTTYRCDCGHVGAVHTKENDAPYSTNWEVTELEGSNGTEQAPACPACGTALQDRHVVPGKPRDYTAS